MFHLLNTLLEAVLLALCSELALTSHIKSPSQDTPSSKSNILAGPASGVHIEVNGVDVDKKPLSLFCYFGVFFLILLNIGVVLHAMSPVINSSNTKIHP